MMGNDACPVPFKGEFERQLNVLRQVKTIAVVGMSPDVSRPSYEVGFYLRDHGYTILPVHPKSAAIGDLKAYPNLVEAGKVASIDLVDLFVTGERTRAVVEDALKLGIKKIWFQPGAEHAETEAWAKAQGIDVISHACTMAVLERGGK